MLGRTTLNVCSEMLCEERLTTSSATLSNPGELSATEMQTFVIVQILFHESAFA